MSKIILEARGDVAVLRLNDGVTHPISPAMLDDLATALLTVEADYGGLVLAGGDKFFCIGFDLPTLLTLDRNGMTAFYRKFNAVVLGLHTLPLPTCGVVAGHATAGGCVLATTCDFRVAVPGKKLIGLNEVKLGLPVPYLCDLILRQMVGDRTATRMLFEGAFLSMQAAERCGLVDTLAPAEEAEALAIARVAAMAAYPREALRVMKANRVRVTRRKYEHNIEVDTRTFLDCWFGADVQRRLREAAKMF